jgi:hypothetical protein
MVDLTGFDLATGLGTVSVNITSSGPHYVAGFVDHELDQTMNTFFNEIGSATGSLAPGQSWEIDEPGYRGGNLGGNLLSGRLDNSNGVPSNVANDVALALAWTFFLASNQTARVDMTATQSVPTNAFFLVQTDPQSGRTLYFSSTLAISGCTNRPTILCPANIIVECAPPEGQRVNFVVSATSSCASGVAVSCVPPSGTLFTNKTTEVNCTATDTVGNTNDCSFTVALVSTGTNCAGSFVLNKETCDAGEVHASPLRHPYPCGTCVHVTGVAAQGWTFMGWLGDERSTEEAVLLTMTQNKCVEAVFGAPVSVEVSSNGIAWLDPAVPLFPCGARVRALATPNPGYYFSHWTDTLTGSYTPLEFAVAQTNARLTPVFLPLPPGQFALTVETRGRGGVAGETRPLLNLYPAGSNVVVRATPDSGQCFQGWAVDSADTNLSPLLTSNPLTVLMNSNQTVVAHFTERPWIELVRCQGELPKDIFRMKVHGTLGRTYVIEATTNIVVTVRPCPCCGILPPEHCWNGPHCEVVAHWDVVARGTNVLGAVQYEDPYLPNVPQRFYRARLEQ